MESWVQSQDQSQTLHRGGQTVQTCLNPFPWLRSMHPWCWYTTVLQTWMNFQGNLANLSNSDIMTLDLTTFYRVKMSTWPEGLFTPVLSAKLPIVYRGIEPWRIMLPWWILFELVLPKVLGCLRYSRDGAVHWFFTWIGTTWNNTSTSIHITSHNHIYHVINLYNYIYIRGYIHWEPLHGSMSRITSARSVGIVDCSW